MLLLYAVDSKIKVVPLLLLVLNFFGHRVTAVLAFLYLVIYTAMKRMHGRIPAMLVLFLSVFLVAGFFLPGILNLFDSERLRGILTSYPQFAPYSFIKTFGSGLISPWWSVEIVFCCMLFAAALVYGVNAVAKKKADVPLTVLLLMLAFMIFPFLRWSMDGPGFRLLLIFILLCPLFVAFLLRHIRLKYAAPALCVLFFVAGFFSYRSYAPSRHDPPYGLYDMMSRELKAWLNKDSCELIIAHKSLAEYVVYATGIDAMSWIPEYEIEKEKLWRIAAGVKDVQFSFYLDAGDLEYVQRLSPSYSLVREDVWRKFMESLKKDGNDELISELTHWKNPDKPRPYFLLKNKREAFP